MRDLGIKVYLIGRPVDALVTCYGVATLLEIKTPSGSVKRTQIAFLGAYEAPCGIVTTVKEALRLAYHPLIYQLTHKERLLMSVIAEEMKERGQKTMSVPKLRKLLEKA